MSSHWFPSSIPLTLPGNATVFAQRRCILFIKDAKRGDGNLQLCWARVKVVYFPKVYFLPNWGIEPRFWVHNLNLTPVLACLLIELCVLFLVFRKTCFFQYWPPGHLLCLSCTGQYKRMVHLWTVRGDLSLIYTPGHVCHEWILVCGLKQLYSSDKLRSWNPKVDETDRVNTWATSPFGANPGNSYWMANVIDPLASYPWNFGSNRRCTP